MTRPGMPISPDWRSAPKFRTVPHPLDKMNGAATFSSGPLTLPLNL